MKKADGCSKVLNSGKRYGSNVLDGLSKVTSLQKIYFIKFSDVMHILKLNKQRSEAVVKSASKLRAADQYRHTVPASKLLLKVFMFSEFYKQVYFQKTAEL